MPLVDVKDIAHDERVHWALFLVFTGFVVYPDVKGFLVSIQVTAPNPIIYLTFQNSGFCSS
jgi:hypothetical protein